MTRPPCVAAAAEYFIVVSGCAHVCCFTLGKGASPIAARADPHSLPDEVFAHGPAKPKREFIPQSVPVFHLLLLRRLRFVARCSYASSAR